MENQQNTTNNEELKSNADGIDKWNERLDENLESEKEGNLDADEKARAYSAENGSGDQSDETLIEEKNPKTS